jgi:VanZ family protein
MKNLIFRWLPLLLCLVFIFIASMNHNPYGILPAKFRQSYQVAGHTVGEVELFGKPGHVIEYALLGAAAANAFIWTRKPSMMLFILIFIGSEFYALSDEIHQIFVPGRAFDIPDLFIDGTGILLGISTYWLVRWLYARKGKSQP